MADIISNNFGFSTTLFLPFRLCPCLLASCFFRFIPYSIVRCYVVANFSSLLQFDTRGKPDDFNFSQAANYYGFFVIGFHCFILLLINSALPVQKLKKTCNFVT